MKEMKGVCFLHTETGTEGGYWAIQEDGFSDKNGYWGYEGLRLLEEGDDFTVFAEDGSVLWHGIIHQDTKTGAVPHILNPSWKQQVAGGLWVHWIQKGMDPEDWAKLFARGKKRCILKRREKPGSREAARSLAALEGTMPDLQRIPRRRMPRK